MTLVVLILAAALVAGLRPHRHPTRRPARACHTPGQGVSHASSAHAAHPGRRGALLKRATRGVRAYDTRNGGRGRALLVVAALFAGSALVGAPAVAAPFDCKVAPEPDRPATGLVGSLDPAPLGVGAPGSVYSEVGYAGQLWYTYDLGCGPDGVRDPSTSTDTWLGNQVFNLAKFVVGGVNWSHYLIQRGSDLLAPLDGVVKQGTTAMYQTVFTSWVGLVLLVLAVILLVLAARGDLSRQALRVGVAVIALSLAAAAYLAPVSWSRAADGLLLDGVTAMQQGFLSQLGAGDKDTLPTVLVDQVVFTNWERGEFGSVDVPQAQQLGRDLLRAQTFTKQEVADHHDTVDDAKRKKDQFNDIATKMGDRYAYFQGRSGSRIGIGVLALVQALCIALFQLMSKVLVLVAMLMIRLLVMTAPAVAVLALLKPDVLPAVLKVGGAAVVNTLLVGGLAGLHALLVVSLFRAGSGVDIWLALLVTGVVTVVMWAVARPFRRLVSMVTLARDQFAGFLPRSDGGPMSRMMSRMRGPREDRQERWWDERRSQFGATPRYDGSGGPRPETAPTEAPRSVIKVDATVVRDGRAQTATAAVGAATPVGAAIAAAGAAGRGRGSRTEAIGAVARRALPAGGGPDVPGANGVPVRDDPRLAGMRPTPAAAGFAAAEEDRAIYRRPAPAAPGNGHRRPIEPELVDGVPVYRIYRPRPAVGPGVDGTTTARARASRPEQAGVRRAD